MTYLTLGLTVLSNAVHQAEKAEEAARRQRLEQENVEHQHALNERILLERKRKQEQIQRATEAERERKRKEEAAFRRTAVGELERREITFDRPITSPDRVVSSFQTWRAYGAPRKNGLWTSYDVEPVYAAAETGIGSSSSVPMCCLGVIDFATAYYETAPGRRKIDALVIELEKLVAIKNIHVLQLHAIMVRNPWIPYSLPQCSHKLMTLPPPNSGKRTPADGLGYIS
jgi:translation initiation factor 2-alpha kinase 4